MMCAGGGCSTTEKPPRKCRNSFRSHLPGWGNEYQWFLYRSSLQSPVMLVEPTVQHRRRMANTLQGLVRPTYPEITLQLPSTGRRSSRSATPPRAPRASTRLSISRPRRTRSPPTVFSAPELGQLPAGYVSEARETAALAGCFLVRLSVENVNCISGCFSYTMLCNTRCCVYLLL